VPKTKKGEPRQFELPSTLQRSSKKAQHASDRARRSS